MKYPAVCLPGWATVATLLAVQTALAQPFQLPTANRALFEPGGEERYFVGTVGKPWVSGTFGCVRTGGTQMHEGLDIRCLERDKAGEPIDPVLATLDGEVAYASHKAALSNYGKYIVLRHEVEGMEVYSLYAHLRAIRPGLQPGQAVKAGEAIGTLGRTANTREGISKDRAHLHFELNLLINERFPAWYRKSSPGQRNDHGQWNGQNFLGFDPGQVLKRQREQGPAFSLTRYLQGQAVLCRVLVRKTEFPWLRRYPALIRPNPVAEKEGTAAYEIALTFNGLPVELVPRAASELPGKSKAAFQVLSVDAAERERKPCGRLVARRGAKWELTHQGTRLLELLTY